MLAIKSDVFVSYAHEDKTIAPFLSSRDRSAFVQFVSSGGVLWDKI